MVSTEDWDAFISVLEGIHSILESIHVSLQDISSKLEKLM